MNKKLSIVICTYNRSKHIINALKSMSMQTAAPSEYEVLIIDNNSTDGTAELVQTYISQDSRKNFKYIFEPNQGLSYARNRGIKEAKSDIIYYMDDDGNAHNTLVEETLKFYAQYAQAIGMGGKVIPYYEGIEPTWMNSYLEGLVTLHDKGNKLQKYAKNEYPVGCSMSYKKDVLEKAGGFDNKLKWRADDKFIGIEVRKISDEIYYNPNVLTLHFIDAYRLEYENFKNLCIRTGQEERIRIINQGLSLPKKTWEYFYKYLASMLLYGSYTLSGHASKGKYIYNYRLWALQGLRKKSK